jgi:hypothetical protein
MAADARFSLFRYCFQRLIAAYDHLFGHEKQMLDGARSVQGSYRNGWTAKLAVDAGHGIFRNLIAFGLKPGL